MKKSRRSSSRQKISVERRTRLPILTARAMHSAVMATTQISRKYAPRSYFTNRATAPTVKAIASATVSTMPTAALDFTSLAGGAQIFTRIPPRE